MKTSLSDLYKKSSGQKAGWTKDFCSLLILILLALMISSCSGYELKNEFSFRFRNLFGKFLKQGLVLDKNPLGGMVEGIYRDDQGQKIEFFAGESGHANLLLFSNKDARPVGLYVSSVDSVDASMRLNYYDTSGNWHTVTTDGLGALTAEEQTALADLMNVGLIDSLMLLPLDLACQGEDQVSPAQVAALLYPAQMLFKYQITDRAAMAEKLMSLSQCDYGDREDITTTSLSQILFTPANPVPVVLGYFPFDPEGAVDPSITGAGGAKMACLDASFWPAGAETANLLALNRLPASDSIIGQYGPCEAKCRGACGPDCTINNCTLKTESRCEKDDDGTNTGSWSMFHIYTCGLHPACIKHDACYDECNRRYGCGTWAASFCKHSVTLVTAPFEYFSGSYLSCDSTTLIEEDPANVKDWVRGYGPKTKTQVFEYRDKQFRYVRDTHDCPTRAAEGETGIEEQVAEPQAEPQEQTELVNEEEPLSAKILNWPIPIEEDEIVEVSFEIRGGTLIHGGKQGQYTAEVFWGDGTFQEVQPDAFSEQDGATLFTLEHSWEEPKTYTVLLLVEDPTGAMANAEAEIVVGTDLSGTFKGETGFLRLFEPLVVREDQFTLSVDEEGKVSGLFWYDYITTIENIEMSDGDVCTMQYHFAANISISDQLVDNKGMLSADFVPTICEHIGTCSANIGCGSGGIKVYIEIINGKLEGHWLFDDYPDLILPFQGSKQ
jgi:hypothetical protein